MRADQRATEIVEDIASCGGAKQVLWGAIKSAIEEAAAEEREACAIIAENFGNAPPNPEGRRAQLAAQIRARGKTAT
jgi:hypothetical protein